MIIKGIDLFCGVGGLSYGLVRAGIEITAGVDIDEECRFPYEQNNPGDFYAEDVATLTSTQVREWLGKDVEISLLAGCAPCQPFSTYSRASKSKDWRLLDSFTRLVQDCAPSLVTMENVPGLAKTKVYSRFIETLTELKYHVTEIKSLNCLHYGIPQRRSRLVVLASKFGPIEHPRPTHELGTYRTVKEAIGHLTQIPAGGRSRKDALHISAGLSELNLKRIRASKPGGTWREWPKELIADCHARKSGKTYPSVYGRMRWDKPSPTITTQAHGFGNGRFGHPTQNRAISLREAAMLQTFPEDYAFVDSEEKINFTKLGRFIGNAVPVRLGEVIGQELIKHVATVTGMELPQGAIAGGRKRDI
jgi:DNA (cytosine-5)-methyltransferase 1